MVTLIAEAMILLGELGAILLTIYLLTCAVISLFRWIRRYRRNGRDGNG